jgi:WD40 repeat protein
MQHPSPPPSLLKLVDDCERFVLGFFDVIEESAMHIYHSALPWSPTSSLTRKLYQRHMSRVKLVNGIDASWDACIRTIPIRDGSNGIAFSHNSASLAVVSFKRVTVFETATGVATFEVHQPTYVCSVAFSPDHNVIVCGLMDGSVCLWDVQTSSLVQSFEGHTSTVDSVSFSPSGTAIASASQDHTVRVWDILSGRCKCVLKGHSGWVRAVCWSGKGDQVISGSRDTTVRMWDISKQACLMILREHTDQVTSVATWRDSFFFASGSLDKTVKVYNSRSGDIIRTISTDGDVFLIQIAAYTGQLIYKNLDSATICDPARDSRTSTIKCDGRDAAISPDGARVASGSGKFVKIWSTENGYSNSETSDPWHHSRQFVTGVFFAPDGHLMASWSDRHVDIWDTTSGKCLFTFSYQKEAFLRSHMFSLNSAFFACMSGDIDHEKHALVWDVHTGSLVHTIGIVKDTRHVALSPGGSRLVSLSSSSITLWDLGSGTRLAHLEFEALFTAESRVAFAVDGTSVFVNHEGEKWSWRIASASSLSDLGSSSTSGQPGASLPQVFLPIQANSSNEDGTRPRQYCRYEGDEWILDQDGQRILWIPLDRKSWWTSRDFHGKKVAITTKSKRVYIVDLSDVLPS